ncbi:hypothetical protein BJ166DRAFT_598179 [Pestalotiopsis sp. NC0098]|nr:hypothetical protein BJ166DRAFT_598179 [Pestalotiopsis sp. NC0098]
MKYTTVAALLPLASAANVNARQDTGIKFEVTDFTAACTSDSDYCWYGISLVTSNNPEFGQSCQAMGNSTDGHLPAVPETQCGTDEISVATTDDGGLVLTVSGDNGRLTGTHTISSDDLKTETSGDKELQSYAGDPDFTIDASGASSPSGSPSGTTASSTATASTSSVAPTTTETSTIESSPSTTGSATSSSTSPSQTNGAIRESASTAALFIFGVFGFGFLL